MSDVLQVVGAILILVPFAWQQLGSLSPERPAYLWPNLVGSAVLAYLALDGSQWGFLLLEAVWALVAARGLLLRGADRAAGHH
jgi:hypothetical protein